MKTNKLLLGGLAGGVAFFLLGWLIWGMFLTDFMQTNYDHSLMKADEDMIWWAMFLSNLGLGFMLAFIFSWANKTTISDGAKTGAIIGALYALSVDLSFYSMMDLFKSFTPVVVDVIVFAIMSAIAGAFIVWVMNLVKNKA